MKETVDYVKDYFREAYDVAKLQWKPFVAIIIILGLVYLGSIFIPPGWATWAVIAPPALFIAITSLALVNDIGPDKMGPIWQIWRVGLIMVGVGAVMILFAPFVNMPIFPTWRGVVLTWGIALTWVTIPPWYDYITGEYKKRPQDPTKPRSPVKRLVDRITREHDANEIRKAQMKDRGDV